MGLSSNKYPSFISLLSVSHSCWLPASNRVSLYYAKVYPTLPIPQGSSIECPGASFFVPVETDARVQFHQVTKFGKLWEPKNPQIWNVKFPGIFLLKTAGQVVSLPRNDAPLKWRCRGPSCVIAFGKSEVQYHPILGNSMNVWADLNTSSNFTGRRSLWALRPGKLEAHGLCVAQNNHQRFQIITRNVHRIAAIQNRRFILGKKDMLHPNAVWRFFQRFTSGRVTRDGW